MKVIFLILTAFIGFVASSQIQKGVVVDSYDNPRKVPGLFISQHAGGEKAEQI